MIQEIHIDSMSEIDLSKAIFGSSSSNSFNASNSGGVKIGSGYSSGYVSSVSSVRYGTCQTDSLNGSVTVLMDGSDETMVVSTNETLHVGDRVSVVSSNGSYKAIALGDSTVGGNMIAVDETFTNKLTASEAFIDKLTASTAFITNLTANNAFIQHLTASNAFISELTANKALIDSLTASDALISNLTASTAFIDSLTSSTALIEKLTGNEAFISSIAASEVLTDNLSAKYVQTDKANIDKAWIDDLFVQGSFVSQEGSIFNLTGLHIDAGDITTGTLVVDRLAVKSEEDGEYYMLTPDPDGGFTQVKLDGNIIEKDSINADRILANSITTEQITTNNLVGTGGWINLANGTFHYSNAETGGYISWDGSHLEMNVNTLTIGGLASATKDDVDNVSDTASNALIAATKAQDVANQNAIDLTKAITNFNQDLSAIQSQVDGSIMTWFYDGVPTESNEPAVNWTTESDKNVHLGDLYYDNDTGYCYRWMVSGSTYSWSRVTDSDVTKALSDASLAKDTADQKRRVFYNTPTPPYDRGDLWVQGTSGDIMRCSVAKTSSQTYSSSDWVKASKYTDDTVASEALTNADQAISDASDAAKVATNYLEYSSSGLTVGNKSNNTWSGYRTRLSSSGVDFLNGSGTSIANFSSTARIGSSSSQNAYIDSSSFNIRSGSTVQSSFAASRIDLAKNSLSAVIGFCDGSVELTANSSSTFKIKSSIAEGYIGVDTLDSTTSFPAGKSALLDEVYYAGGISSNSLSNISTSASYTTVRATHCEMMGAKTIYYNASGAYSFYVRDRVDRYKFLDIVFYDTDTYATHRVYSPTHGNNYIFMVPHHNLTSGYNVVMNVVTLKFALYNTYYSQCSVQKATMTTIYSSTSDSTVHQESISGIKVVRVIGWR